MILISLQKNNETKSQLGRVARLSSRDALGAKVGSHWGIFDERIALNLQASYHAAYIDFLRLRSIYLKRHSSQTLATLLETRYNPDRTIIFAVESPQQEKSGSLVVITCRSVYLTKIDPWSEIQLSYAEQYGPTD